MCVRSWILFWTILVNRSVALASNRAGVHCLLPVCRGFVSNDAPYAHCVTHEHARPGVTRSASPRLARGAATFSESKALDPPPFRKFSLFGFEKTRKSEIRDVSLVAPCRQNQYSCNLKDRDHGTLSWHWYFVVLVLVLYCAGNLLRTANGKMWVLNGSWHGGVSWVA